jgi:glycerate dehydrogenase
MHVPADYFAEFSSTVKLLCESGTGYNNLPVQQARNAGIPVCNIPTYSTEAVAHMAITYIMNFSVSMFEQQRMLLQNDRSNFIGPFTLPLHEINNKTLGLVGGAGRIGTKVAEIGLALGMNVIISSRRGSLPRDHILHGNPRVQCTDNVDMLLQQADYVSLHTPLNDETRGTFGQAQISQMKPTAFLINTSRGAVCKEDELIECLQQGLIAGAGLDVTATEPPSPDSPLWTLPNCWLSPHTGWRRLETRQRLVDMTAENIAAF